VTHQNPTEEMVWLETAIVETSMWKKVANYLQIQDNMEMIAIAGGEDGS
jgi:hypothetical protein